MCAVVRACLFVQTLGLGYARRASEVLYSGAGGGQPDEDLKLAALLLRKAAGVFTHLADTGWHTRT